MEKALIKKGSWEDLIEAYLAQKDVRTAKPHYRGHLKRFFQWVEREYPSWLETGGFNPQKADLLRWRNELADKVDREEYSAYTVNLALTAVKGFFEWLYDEELIKRDPMRKIKGLKTGGGSCKDALTTNAVQKIIITAKSLRDRAILHLMISTGIRCCEVSRANVEDISIIKDQKVLYVRGKKRNAKDDFVTLAEDTVQLITLYLKNRKVKLNDPLFVSESRFNKGERMSPDSISRLIKRHLKAIGEISPRLSGHSLRHTTATVWVDNGGDIYEAQINLRHASSDTTRRYLHDQRKLKSRFSEKIIEYLGVKLCQEKS
jgi:site-specific recombinase XerD